MKRKADIFFSVGLHFGDLGEILIVFWTRKGKSLRLDFSKYELLRCNSEKSKNLKKIHSIALGELLLEI